MTADAALKVCDGISSDGWVISCEIQPKSQTLARAINAGLI